MNKPNNKKVAIIILTWNGLELTKTCLNSLLKSDIPSLVELIFVDNGSKDGTVEYLRGIKNIKLIENNANLGYSKAVNIGISSASKDADIVLLNNDVELIQKKWLQKLQENAYSKKEIGIAGVKILKPDLTIQHCGAYLPMDTMWGQQLAGGEVDIGQFSGVHEVESVVFACAYIKREVIEKVGLLSEDFFAYFEDTDYCLRSSLKGYKTVMCGDIVIVHAENSSTKINGVSHNKIFLESQKTFKEKWAIHLEENRYSKFVDWHSIINFPSGYAGSSRNFVLALDKQGVHVSYKYVYGPGTVFPVEEPEHSDSYLINMIRKRRFGEAPVQVVYAQGDVFEKNSGKYRIGYTMLEVDGIPREWVRQANLMDEIWVPSEFNKITFQNSGVEVPIKVVPLGIDSAYFSENIKSYKNDKLFTFLSVFEWGERKAPEILLRAFADEFSRGEAVQLICKSNNFDPSFSIRSEVEKLKLRKNSAKILFAENQILQQYELGVLYKSVDCFVLPTRGEGWGMPILEAMACGLPVIATDWSSQRDFMNDSNALPVEVEKLVLAEAKCPYYKGFKWAEPSYEHLRKRMRWVYENQIEAKEIGKKAAQDVKENWTWDNSAKIMIDLFGKII